MNMNDEQEKISIISYLVIAAFILLSMRLWQLQILQGSDYLKLSEENRLRVINIPAPRGIIFDRNNVPLVKNAPYFSLSVIPDEFDMNKIGDLSQFIKIPVDEIHKILNKNNSSPFSPIKLKRGLSFEELAYIEARKSDFPGLIIETDVSREYIYKETGSHLIGYLGKLNPSQSKDPAHKDIPPDAFIGQWGVEKLFDDLLRGMPGEKIIEVNALGREIRLLQENPPVKGEDITLSIDIHLQEEAEKAFGEKSGALVAIKPDTGEILGMISKPTFDPNYFSQGITSENWTSLIENPKKPMLNRALQSQYPPGSTFKLVTAIAGMEEGVINPDTTVNCRGGIYYGRRHFGCWRRGGHGFVALHRAIVESCDVYFYEVGRRLGIDRIHDYALSLGLGSKTGIDFEIERQGLIPNTGWKAENKGQSWFPGETLIAAIGQGYVSVTPIQLAVMTSSIANDGKIYKPVLLKNAEPVLIKKAEIKPETFEIVKNSMLGVVNNTGGTGWAARSRDIFIAGKTGTAQVISAKGTQYLPEKFRDHAWFVAFAPIEKPEIAVSVLVEHGGHGGVAAAPIAKRAIEAYLKPKPIIDN